MEGYGLWLPSDYLERNQQLRRAGMLTFIGWSDVTDSSIGMERLRKITSSMPSESLLILISTISIVQTNTPWNLDALHRQQRELAGWLCRPAIAHRVEQLITNRRGDAIVHEEQLLIAARLAILYGQPGPPEPISLELFGELLLGINDLLLLDEGETTTLNNIIITRVLRRRGISRNEQMRYLLARYFDLLVIRSRKSQTVSCDLDKAFFDETGMRIEEYIAFAFLYLFPFYGKTSVKELQDVDFSNIVYNYEKQIREPKMLERCRLLFSNNIVGFNTALSLTDPNPCRSSFRPFQQNPLFRRENGAAIPISLPLLMEKVSIGIYWTLHQHFSHSDRKEGVRTLTSHVGLLFQDYITDLLTRTYQGPQCIKQHFFDEKTIIKSSLKAPLGTQPPFDGIIVSGNSIVIIEMFSGTIPAQIMDTGDFEAFVKMVGRKGSFVDKIKQLNNAFEGIANGTWVVPELDRRSIYHIYPVLVLLHPFPQTAATWQPLRDAALPNDMYQFGGELFTTRVYEPQILTAEELEMLEPLLHEGEQILPGLLQYKLNNQDTAVMSMKTFLLRILHFSERPNEHMLKLFNAVTTQLRDLLKEHIDFASEGTNTEE